MESGNIFSFYYEIDLDKKIVKELIDNYDISKEGYMYIGKICNSKRLKDDEIKLIHFPLKVLR